MSRSVEDLLLHAGRIAVTTRQACVIVLAAVIVFAVFNAGGLWLIALVAAALIGWLVVSRSFPFRRTMPFKTTKPDDVDNEPGHQQQPDDPTSDHRP